MARSRGIVSLKLALNRHRVWPRLRVLLLIVAVAMFIKPVRNALVPGFPDLFRDISTLKLIWIHLADLLYYIDRTPYQGSCQFVHDKLAKYKKPDLEKIPVYELSDWNRGVVELKEHADKETWEMLDSFKPNLSPIEMKQLIYTTVYISTAFIAFNISHFFTEGSLIGAWRHHGPIPWDDDVDMQFDASQWRLAKKVISCLPDIQLDMGSDFLWKAFHQDSQLWRGESYIKFPFVDLLPYRYDSDYVWPLTIWAKAQTMSLTKQALPPVQGVFGGWPVMLAAKTGPALAFVYGDVMKDCYSRIFERRKREMIPPDKVYKVPCKLLSGIYPFVRREKTDKRTGTVLEELVLKNKVLSSFNTTFQNKDI